MWEVRRQAASERSALLEEAKAKDLEHQIQAAEGRAEEVWETLLT